MYEKFAGIILYEANQSFSHAINFQAWLIERYTLQCFNNLRANVKAD